MEHRGDHHDFKVVVDERDDLRSRMVVCQVIRSDVSHRFGPIRTIER